MSIAKTPTPWGRAEDISVIEGETLYANIIVLGAGTTIDFTGGEIFN